MRISDWSSDVCSSDHVRRLPSVADLGPHEVTQEALVGGGEEERPAERCQLVMGAQQLQRLRLGLAEVEPGIEHHRSADSRVGKDSVSTCRSRGSPYHAKKKFREREDTQKQKGY